MFHASQSTSDKTPWIIWITGIYLLSEVLAAPIRYFVSKTGFPELIYGFKLVLIVGVLIFVIQQILSEGKIHSYSVILGVILLVWGVVGYLGVKDIIQVAFGFWIFVPMIAGYILSSEIISRWQNWNTYVFIIWGLLVIGILLNFFFTFPWEGHSFSIGSHDLVTSKIWWSWGLKRLAGFGRSSTIVSHQLVLFSVLLAFFTNGKKAYLVFLVTLISTILTTNKTTPIIVLLIIGIWLIYSLKPKFANKLLKVIILGMAILLLVLPILSYPSYQNPMKTDNTSIVRTLIMRFTWTWPKVFAFVVDQGNVITGLGVGRIGTAQKLFSPDLVHKTDNLSVYIYGTFGVIGLFFIGFLIYKIISENFLDRSNFLLGLLALAVISFGITNNVIESSGSAFLLGLLFKRSFQESPRLSKYFLSFLLK